MKKITFLIAFLLSLITGTYAQTVLIDPAGGGGFASGATFAANGWTVANSTNNQWYVGPVAASGIMAGNVAYVSNTGGTSHVYDVAIPTTNFFWRDVTIPAGETKINLTFNWYGQGESTWDMWQVFVAPTSVTPVASTTHPGSGATIVPPGIAGATFIGNGNLQGAVQTATYTLPTYLAGTTFRLIFSWKSDTSTGTQPPAAIDNISLKSQAGLNYVSIATGNFGAASTWNLNSVPTADDNITVAAGHTVTINATGQSANNAIINGTLDYGTTPGSFAIRNNLTVNSGGTVNVFNGTTGKTLSVEGNIINNGSVNISVGSSTAGNLTLNGSTVQTLSGTGLFVNNIIRNLVFTNTSNAVPNINWQMNNLIVENELNITNAKINLGTNKLTHGISLTSTGGTFTFLNGGFMGGKFARWWGNTSTGYVSAGPTTTIPTSAAGLYPYYSADGQQRVFYLGRTTPTVGGIYAVVYNDAITLTSGLSIVDGAYTITDRWNGNFVVSTEGTSPVAASNWVSIFAPNAYYPVNTNSRVVGQSAAISGTHTGMSSMPAAQRSGVLTADLLAATGLYLGVGDVDLPFVAVTSGDWNLASTWNKGTVPTCNDLVTIARGVNITVNSAGIVAKGLTITAGASLTITSGSLTIGCTLKNNSFVNNGTFTITGGTLNVNGSMSHNAGSIFNQSGGDINVDGNDAGAAATSVASGVSIVQLNSNFLNWTGGTLTIVDPHANSTASNAFTYTNSTPVNITTGHTIRFGDGVSTDAGGNTTNGFRINTYGGSNNRLSLNNVVINGGSGTNRYITIGSNIAVNGNLTITANSSLRGDSSYSINVNGNIQNDGTFVTTSNLVFGTYLFGVSGQSGNAQTVSGSGLFVNATSTPTANFSSVTINNSNPAGVTFTGTSSIVGQPANSISANGTLTFTLGKINTVGGLSFVLGSSASTVGTLSYTSGGFVPGVVFGRWFSATGTGSSITAGSDASTVAGRFPFVNSLNEDRSSFIERTTPAAAGGILGITYNQQAGTTAVNVIDTSSTPNFTVDTKVNDTWSVSVLGGTPTAAASFKLHLLAPGIFVGPTVNANARIIQGTSLVGVHQGGTTTPGAQRITILPADLVAAPFAIATSVAELPFVSITNGDWNNPTTWNKNAIPSCADIATIATGTTVTVNSAANVIKNVTILSGGTLAIASGDLTVGCTLKNNSFVNNGTLTVTGGALNVNGSMLHNATSIFNQSGGNINVDGNDAGAAATSVASGVSIIQLNSQFLNWTGGTLTIIDPHANSTASNAFTYTNSAAVNITAGHTIRFGDGVSTDAGGSATNGFRINTYGGSNNRITFYNFIVNGGTATNRHVTTTNTFGINGNMTVSANSEYRDTAVSTYVAGNLQNDGKYLATGTMVFGTYLGGVAGPSTLAQTVSGIGTFANSATTPTASVISLTVNNTNATGVTLNIPMSVSSTLTLTEGKLNTTTANLLTLGTATAAGTLTGGSATAYVVGPIARTIANTNTSYVLFPVGKAAYAPISLSPATTAVSVMKAEAFDTNTGTQDPAIINLAGNRRWEAPLLSGTMTTLNVRLGDPVFTSENIPVTAPAADGIYTSTFGSTSTFVAGTPNTIQSVTPVTAANYSGFISYAKSNLCFGTPAPGNTIASSNAICAGTEVTLSVQTGTVGSGVTYQWQSSPDNVTYTDIASATNTTYVTTPTASLYYQLKVTCATGPATGISTPVHVTFANSVATTTPGTRCGKGTISLSATPSTGATIKWYAAATGGTAVATGSPFVTPSIDATTTYYAASEVSTVSISDGARIAPAATAGTTPSSYGLEFTATSSFILNSVDVYLNSSTAGSIVVVLTNMSGSTLQTSTIAVPAGDATTPVKAVLNLGWSITPGNYRILAVSGPSMVREGSLGGFPYALGSLGSVTGGYISGASSTYYFFYNWNLANICSSARVPVVATVNTPPAITLSAAPPVVCSGQTTTAVTIATGASDYDTYAWTPSTGVSGNATTGWTFNPAASTVYSLQATSSTGAMCVAVPVTINISINPLPTPIVTAPTVAVCEGTAQALVATGGANPQQVIQETFDVLSTQFVTASTAGTASATLNTTYFSQGTGSVLFTPTGNSSDVSYSSNANIDLTPYGGAQLTFSHIAAIEGNTTSWDLGYVQYSSDGGTTWVTFPTSSYAGAGTLMTMQGTTNPVDGVIFSTKSYPDWIAQFTGTTSVPNSTSLWKTETINIPAAALTSQFRVRFRYTAEVTALYYGWLIDNLKITGLKSNLVWSPATNLYTDAAATIPYTGQSLNTVFVKPTAATSYTVTATSPAGCSVTAPVAITISVVAAPTVATPVQDICNAGTVANLAAIGTGIKWYAAATGGTALPATTALVNGTTYYASQTVSGCESVGRIGRTVNITVVAAPTALTTTQEFCNSGTVANLNITGTAVKWYAAATGGTALLATTALVNGTTYYASQTIGTCESAIRTPLTVNINVTNIPTVPAPVQQFCSASTIADITVTGIGVKWYSAASGGTALASTTALVDDTTYYAASTAGTCESATRTALTVNITLVTAPTVAGPSQDFCNAGTVANLVATGTAIKWYTAATGGTALLPSTALVNGTTYYASQTIDTCESTTRTALTANVNLVPAPTVPALVQEICNSGAVGELITNSGINIKWYAAATGGTALESSLELVDDTTYYASQTIGTCESATRTALIVNINVTPVPTGNTTQAFCSESTVGNLNVTGNAIVWYDQAIGGNVIATTTPIVSGTTYYASQNIDGCEGITRLAVEALITPAIVDDLADVNECSQYTLPVLTNGSYFTGTNGTGTPLAAGGVITQTTTIYVYTSVGTNPVCTAESSFVVTIANVLAPQGAATQTINADTPADATIEDIVVTLDAGGTIKWYATEEDASNGTNVLPVTTQLVNGEDYFATQNIGTCTSIVALKVTIDIVLGRDTFNKDVFTYYPNPVKDVLNLAYTSDITSVAVFNLLGQQVISQQPNTGEVKIDMSSLADGAYIVNVTSGSTIKTIKVIKKQ